MTAQTFTLRDVAIAAHTKHGMDTTAAEDIARTYLDQMDAEDGIERDEDELTQDDFDFLLGAIDSARRAGDLGLRELDTVAEAAQDMEDKAQALEHARAERDDAIRAAVHAGARIQDVATAAGISRQAVDKIIRA
ncbi:TPA: hypothetical protein NJV08_002698 [Corynebacterium striatum]|nr:hypothetical protein [Corynebacterium striatum]HCG2979924.1 hypothetical protein [Corynebacterium striatum]HCG2993307.1 hypothetical protein [Corynebacterium striatum]HCG2995966.1 hypothetical protein [Corynebacterium striatum]HCH2243524.1 hypothetical protein [Corynebacterium striatum]